MQPEFALLHINFDGKRPTRQGPTTGPTDSAKEKCCQCEDKKAEECKCSCHTQLKGIAK